MQFLGPRDLLEMLHGFLDHFLRSLHFSVNILAYFTWYHMVIAVGQEGTAPGEIERQ